MQKNEKRRRAGGDGFGPVLPVTECSLYLKAFKGRRTINHVFISFLLNFIRPRSDLSFDTSVPSSSSSVRSSLCSQILPPLWLPGLSLSQSDSTPPNYRDRSRCAVVDRPPPPPSGWGTCITHSKQHNNRLNAFFQPRTKPWRQTWDPNAWRSLGPQRGQAGFTSLTSAAAARTSQTWLPASCRMALNFCGAPGVSTGAILSCVKESCDLLLLTDLKNRLYGTLRLRKCQKGAAESELQLRCLCNTSFEMLTFEPSLHIRFLILLLFLPPHPQCRQLEAPLTFEMASGSLLVFIVS